MNKCELIARLDFLTDVLRYSRGKGYFSAGQRICIHQERSAIMQAREEMIIEDLEAIEPAYRLPEHLEETALRVQKDFHF